MHVNRFRLTDFPVEIMSYFFYWTGWIFLMGCCLLGMEGAGQNTAETYFVSPTGADHIDADGQNRPWQSLGYALSRIPDAGGVEILVQPGTYPALSSTRRFERPVILRAAVPRESILLPGPDQGPVLLTGARNLRLEGFVIDNRGHSAVSNALHILSSCSAIEVVNCRITHGGEGYVNASAVKIHRHVSHILLEDNEIFDACDAEVEISDWAHDIVLRRNVIHRRRSSSREALVVIADRSWRIVMDRNVIMNTLSGNGPCLIRLGSGLEAQEETSEILLWNNLFIQRDAAPALALTGCARALFIRNISYSRPGHTPWIRSWIQYPRLNQPPAITQVYLWGNQVIHSAGDGHAIAVEPELLDSGSVIVLDAGENTSGHSSFMRESTIEPAAFDKILHEEPSLRWLEVFLPNPMIHEIKNDPFLNQPGLPEPLRKFWEEYKECRINQ